MHWIHLLTIVGSSFAAAALAFFGLTSGRKVIAQATQRSLFDDPGASCVFLFDGTDLIDASDGARALLANTPGAAEPWVRLLAFLTPRFPAFERKFARLKDLGRFTLSSVGPHPLTLRAEWRGGMARIVLREPRGELHTVAADGVSQRAMEDEIETLRHTMDRAPFPIWREDAAGSVVWANRAYVDLALIGRSAEDLLSWPLPSIFPAAASGESISRRVALRLPGAPDPRWFDVQVFLDGIEHVFFALPADAAVQAETSLRSFIQTLTKTFAHLRVGLAIFDRQRQLALFNPAVIDLTGLSPVFLSSRPTLFAMLDAMREARMLPEPKDYKTWRAEMTALEAAAAAGQYAQEWNLPNGQTYRVEGRPHPDGAVAFLIEDITAETDQTRSFRAEQALGRAALDTLDEAIAVFSAAGQLVLCNTAHERLWSALPPGSNIAEAVALWQKRAASGPIWGAAQAFVGHESPRDDWTAEARLADGRLLTCRFAALSGGASLVGFAPALKAARPSARPRATGRHETA